MRILSLTSLLAIASAVSASPMAKSGAVAARNCQAEIATFNLARREKRGHAKRNFLPELQNLTCVAAPETPLVDYVANPRVRQDVTEGQAGVALTLDPSQNQI